MDKSEFNLLDITRQIEEFNKLISIHGSASAASKSLGYKDESTLRKRFKNKNYSMNKEKTKYVRSNESETLIKNKSIAKINDKSETKIKNNSDTSVNKQISALNKEIQAIRNFKADITEMFEWYKEQKNKENIIDIEIPEIKISILDKEEKAMTRGLKTYPSVLNKFDEFCTAHKEFRKQDLLAMALTEYINKYSK